MSETSTDASRLVEDTGRAILRLLRSEPEGISKGDLAKRCGVSEVTAQRSLNWLRDVADAPITYAKAARLWVLRDRAFALPLTDPTADDLSAVVFAAAVLTPLGDDELNRRLGRIMEEMDARVRERGDGAPSVSQGGVVASVTAATVHDPRVITVLSSALGRRVLKIRYTSPWAGTERVHEIEPWQLRLHDGAMYLRAYSRTTSSPRNFRVAQIESATVLDGVPPTEPVPPREHIWGAGDPALGIDEDRPDVAIVRIRGGVARWVSRLTWHPEQEDHWIEPHEVLERRVPYRSCREFARRLLFLGEGLESVEPAALREQIVAHARHLVTVLEPT